MSVYSMCSLWCQPCPSGLRSPGSCSPCWVTFLGRARGQSSCLVHLSLPSFFFSSPPVSSRWAPLSDSTCNYTVTFLHLLLQTSPLPPKSSSQPRNSVCVCALITMNKLSRLTQKHAWSKDANAHTAYQHFGKYSLSSRRIFPNFIPVP